MLPFRRLCEELSPVVLKLDPRFDAMGRRGANFSRINRDIRFAKDKTPYRTHMYLKFSVPLPGEMKSGQLYTGISSDTVTAGFRIYAEPKRKLSSIALIAEPRIAQSPRWLAQQKRRGQPPRTGPNCKPGSFARNFLPPPQPAFRFPRMSPKSSATCCRCWNSPHSEIISSTVHISCCNTSRRAVVLSADASRPASCVGCGSQSVAARAVDERGGFRPRRCTGYACLPGPKIMCGGLRSSWA